MTVKDIYSDWLSQKAKTFKPATLSTYVLLVEKHILPHMADKEGITQDDVQAMRDEIVASGISEKTALDCATILTSILRYAAKQGWCDMPTWSLSGKSARKKTDFTILTPAQQRDIIDFLSHDKSPRNIGIYLALTTGITIGELCSLEWQDIDFKAMVLHVRGIVSRHYELDRETSVRTWSVIKIDANTERDIPLVAEQLEFLKNIKGAYLPEVYIMTNRSAPIDARGVRLHLKKLTEAIGINRVQFKDLRHSFAVRCLEAGCNYDTLAQLLGNGSIENLAKTYGPYVKKDVRGCMERVMASMCSPTV